MRVQWKSASSIYKIQERYVSERREVLYNILIEFCVPLKVGSQFKSDVDVMCDTAAQRSESWLWV
jgi:hypothetical protein